MKNVECLLGSLEPDSKPDVPYSDASCKFLSDLSQQLMHSPQARSFPDILSFAFWCRRANIKRLKEQSGIAEARLGRGVTFHIAPSNVPVNFAFSCMFGLLAGNACIVRLPTKPFPQIQIILDALQSVLGKHPALANRLSFVRYEADDETTVQFCQKADARLIWGGDRTVAHIRSLPAKPRCVDLPFADRYSIALLDGAAIKALNASQRAELAKKFYNDTYLMDQNACSSPQMIFWRNANEDMKQTFWDAVAAYAAQYYPLQPASAVDKFDQSCRDAVLLDCAGQVRKYGNVLYRISLREDALPNDISSLRGTCGYFYECNLQWEKLAACVTEKFQTITYYGFQPEEIRQWVLESRIRGIDRIVPVGSAMDIHVIWDGFDIVRMLSRVVDAI